jgi:hypothetical protein
VSIENGGTAFPGFNYVTSNVHDGMTLRDYFAAKAMQGMLSNSNITFPINKEDHRTDAEKYADDSYIFADAMLEARKS